MLARDHTVVSGTHVVMECFGFAAVVAGVSPLRGSAVQVPEDTVEEDEQ